MLSVIAWILIVSYKERTRCYTIGDVLDESEPFMYIPFINTITLIAILITCIICIIIKTLKLDKLFDKIRNIKLR